jgi:hypothetical protein
MDITKRLPDCVQIGMQYLDRVLELSNFLLALMEHTRVELRLRLEARYRSSPDIAAS